MQESQWPHDKVHLKHLGRFVGDDWECGLGGPQGTAVWYNRQRLVGKPFALPKLGGLGQDGPLVAEVMKHLCAVLLTPITSSITPPQPFVALSFHGSMSGGYSAVLTQPVTQLYQVRVAATFCLLLLGSSSDGQEWGRPCRRRVAA